MPECPLNQSIIKLAPLEALLVIGPRGRRHAAIRVQQDPEAAHQQENQKQHQETHECERRPLLRVPTKRRAAGGPGERRPRGQQLVVQRGHIAHPPGTPNAEFTSAPDCGLNGQIGAQKKKKKQAKVKTCDRVTDTQSDTSGAIRGQNDRTVYFRPVTLERRWDMTERAAAEHKKSSVSRSRDWDNWLQMGPRLAGVDPALGANLR